MSQYEFEQKIKDYIKQNGRTQAAIARMLGESPDTFNKWVRGVNRMPIKILHEVCELLQLDKAQRIEIFDLAGYVLPPVAAIDETIDHISPQNSSPQNTTVYSIEPDRIDFETNEEFKRQEEVQHNLEQLYKQAYMAIPSSVEESQRLLNTKYNTSTIRRLLTTAFSDEDFSNFCFDYFRPTYEKFTGGLTRSVKIQLLIEDCDRHDKFEELLARIEEENPTRYAEFVDLLPISEEKSSVIVAPTKKVVQIKIAGDLSEVTSEKKQAIIGAIKGTLVYTLNIPDDEVIVLMDEPGSIVLNLLLPTDVANELLAMQEANDPRIQGLGILQANIVNTAGLNLSGLDLSGLNLSGADLLWVNLSRANLTNTNLSEANLNGANLNWTNLSKANLRGANLTEAQLFETNLRRANLQEANLRDTYLFGTDFREADISRADLTNANVGYTIFGNIDLSPVSGLDTTEHIGPSTIDAAAFAQSRGKIPEGFLQGCGLNDFQIEMVKLHNPELDSAQVANITYKIHDLLVANPIQYHSCFISYTNKDETFAQHLHADLQQRGVRCWFAPEDMKIGDKIRPTIDQTIRTHDKLLVIISKNSMQSAWVEAEVQYALDLEQERQEPVLFPVRLDEAVMETDERWAAEIRRTRHIGDFSRWKDHDAYQKAFERLLRDLKAGG